MRKAQYRGKAVYIIRNLLRLGWNEKSIPADGISRFSREMGATPTEKNTP